MRNNELLGEQQYRIKSRISNYPLNYVNNTYIFTIFGLFISTNVIR